MIRLPVEPVAPPPRRVVSQSSWMATPQDNPEKVMTWIRNNPGFSLMLAMSLGAGLGWLVKTRRR